MRPVLLLALVVSVAIFARALAQASGRASTRYWARHAHRHRWHPVGTSYSGPTDSTLVLEHCRHCPAALAHVQPGCWVVNRLGELSPVAFPSETANLERMWRAL